MSIPVNCRQESLPSREETSRLVLVKQTAKSAEATFDKRCDSLGDLSGALLDSCVLNIAVFNESGRVVYQSKAWQAFWKGHSVAADFSEAASFFKDCTRISHRTPNQSEATLSGDIKSLQLDNEKEFHRRYCYHGLIGPVHFVAHVTRLSLPKSGFRVLISHEDDVSTGEALRRSEERLIQLVERTRIVLWEADAESLRFTFISEHASEMFGYPLARWYEPDFLVSHIHRDDRDEVLTFTRKQSQICDEFDVTFRLLAESGKVVWVHNTVSTTYDDGGATSLRGFMMDITERKCAEEALRVLGGRLIAAQEEERSRIARELHDDLNQRMALLSIALEQLAQENGKSNQLRGRFEGLQRQAQEISADIQRLSHKLHPSMLDHLGLGAAVKGLCEELSSHKQLKIEVRIKGFPATLVQDITLCVFRIAQEALRNCLRHSEAQAVQVVLEKTSSTVRLSVSDDGCGFDTASDATKRGLGFISIRERMRLVGGQVHVYSQPGRGTLIEVAVPLGSRSLDCADSSLCRPVFQSSLVAHVESISAASRTST